MPEKQIHLTETSLVTRVGEELRVISIHCCSKPFQGQTVQRVIAVEKQTIESMIYYLPFRCILIMVYEL